MRSPEAAQRYGRLTTVRSLRLQTTNGHVRLYWECICDCGAVVNVLSFTLLNGKTRSCGCLRDEINHTLQPPSQLTHGYSRSPTYRSWANMIKRCTNPNTVDYRFYGGKGITVCERWRNFPAFLADMGDRPPNLTLDRIDSAGNYEPGNCRWATQAEQLANRKFKNTRG